ncbi:hypothetical protein HX099_10690 [Thiopseudomonas alkaliphila]|uniref:DUF3467 domain-containing protein n=1 Tax=Thiopseudomonas alkaliphila TaxID=1697053 RepID=A0AAW7DUT2_9GAMM|nr:hypothetical protein [Thiopseudomonas alkaliphila]MDM1697120.1 hypothetical protein [Thiopseudomonas alkaliphila]
MSKADTKEISFKKTANHIYESCTEFAVVGAKNNKTSLITLELCRDIIEIKPGTLSNSDNAQIVRLNFATISLDVDTTKKIVKRLQDIVDRMDNQENS